MPFLVFLALIFTPGSLFAFQSRAGGSFKSILQYQRLRHTDVFSNDDLPYSEQRLRLDGSATYGNWRIEAANELSFVWQRALQTSFPTPDFSTPPFWEATSTWSPSDTTLVTQRVDRLFVEYSIGPINVKVGKQTIDEGVGRLFSALSQLPRYSFVFVDTEYPKTEDAVSFVWRGPLTLELRYLPHTRTQRQDNIHLRAKGSKHGYDIALTTGRSDDKPYGGIELAGNVGDSLFRAELVGYQWQPGTGERTALQALAGFDHVFSSKWSGQFEAFYNGFGAASPGPLSLPLHRSSPYRGNWYLGSAMNWEMDPKWKAHLNSILNLNDPSLLLQLFVTYTIAENMELVAAQYLGLTTRPDGEFGGRSSIQNPFNRPWALGLPDLTYVEFKYYF